MTHTSVTRDNPETPQKQMSIRKTIFTLMPAWLLYFVESAGSRGFIPMLSRPNLDTVDVSHPLYIYHMSCLKHLNIKSRFLKLVSTTNVVINHLLSLLRSLNVTPCHSTPPARISQQAFAVWRFLQTVRHCVCKTITHISRYLMWLYIGTPSWRDSSYTKHRLRYYSELPIITDSTKD